MKAWKAFVLAWLLVFLVALAGAALLIHRGFRATNEPSGLEATLARAARDFSIPNGARHKQEQLQQTQASASAHFVGPQACEKCHAEIYEHWQMTPMANIIRDPSRHADAIIADLATNNVYKFSTDQVAFVYGRIWKQRYFTKVGDDYFPLPVQWEVVNKKWSKYQVPPTEGDGWAPFYPGDNMHRPTGPLCDGCHSVSYDIHTKQVAEWNVGCERCHGPGSEHIAHPSRDNTFNPAHMNYVGASDT